MTKELANDLIQYSYDLNDVKEGCKFLNLGVDDTQTKLVMAFISMKERNKMDSADFAWPDEKKFPITDQAHLDAAVKLIGRAPKDKQNQIKANIIKIAKRKGLSLPKSWQ